MIALFDFTPKACPNCGKHIRWDKHSQNDYNVKCSFSCDCGMHYQKVNTDALVKTAQENGGDLPNYY
jgi:L-rhamnose isomerase